MHIACTTRLTAFGPKKCFVVGMCFARGPAFLPSGPLHESKDHFPVTMEDDAGVGFIGVEDISVAASSVQSAMTSKSSLWNKGDPASSVRSGMISVGTMAILQLSSLAGKELGGTISAFSALSSYLTRPIVGLGAILLVYLTERCF